MHILYGHNINPFFPSSFLALFSVHHSFCSSTTKYSRPEDLFLQHHEPDTVDYSTCSSTTGSICGGNCPPVGASTGKLPAFTHLTQIQLLSWHKYSLHPPGTNTIIVMAQIQPSSTWHKYNYGYEESIFLQGETQLLVWKKHMSDIGKNRFLFSPLPSQ